MAQAEFWENIATTCHFDGGKLTEVRIYPLDQGFGARARNAAARCWRRARWRPRSSSGSTGFPNLMALTVKNRDGIGIITL